MKKLTLFSVLALLSLLLSPLGSRAQGSIPFVIANNSPYSDASLYVAIVGINPAGSHVWIDARTGAVNPMSSSYNTVLGPTYNGATGPGGNSRYASCFTRLSDIPNKTFTLPYIAGCRVFISQGQQLYFYFYGATGAPSGYSGPNPQNPNDPNRGILHEMVELTNNQYGFFGNTTRVDSYKYPMGLELFGNGGYQQRTGELKNHADIIAAYKANVPAEFQSTVNNTTGEITFPTKTAAWADGTGGTTPGPQANYMKPYIDAIWNKYKNEDLIFYAGNAGVFKGRVGADDRLVLVGQSGAYAGRTGIVAARPTTQEALEGKGVFDRRIGDGDCDLVVQAQLTAAITRHVVNTTTPNPGQQNFYDASKFYQAAPANYYARFWHLPGISVGGLSYGFAYDDVADQSATLHTPQPTRAVATFGGYAGSAPAAQAIPGTIQGESFTAQSGTQTEPTTDAGGGVNVNWFETNDWLDYRVSVPTAGTYTVGFRVASANGGATLQLRNSTGGVLGSVAVGNTGGWQAWQTISTTVNLPAGVQTLRLHAAASTGCNVNYLTFATASAAFSRQLEAEKFNVNNGMVVETCTDAGGGQNMGYVDAGDYLVFNGINFPTSGAYLIEYRVASGAAGGTISSDLNAGATQLGNTTIPGTGGWQTWTTVSRTVNINAGTYNFGIYAQTGGWNINWIRITKSGTAARGALATNQTASRGPALELYPNPVTNRLSLSSAEDFAGGQVSIFSVDGRRVWQGTYSGQSVDVTGLKAGLYTLEVVTKGQQKLVRRFSKQ